MIGKINFYDWRVNLDTVKINCSQKKGSIIINDFLLFRCPRAHQNTSTMPV